MNRALMSRRTILKGLGVSVALPWLEAMGPLTAWAAGPETANPAPNRMCCLYVPNGIDMPNWTPKAEGKDFDLPSILEPLAEVKDHLLVLTGLTADKARPNGDGPGDHARALAAYLTGAQPRKTDGNDIRLGISVDQMAAARMGHLTRLPSLELGCEKIGGGDSGYARVYTTTMSWRSATQPLPKEVDPRLAFDRLFATQSNAEIAKRDAKQKSILDYVRDDSKDLADKLGVSDKRKLDEYFSAVRDVEVRIEKAEKMPPVKAPDNPTPPGVPVKYEEHVRVMYDIIALALQADVTRVVTFVLSNEVSNRTYPMVGVSEAHHDTSHHMNDPKKRAKICKINTFHTTQLAYFLKKLKDVKEGDGTLLDHVMVSYGSGNSDGNRHNHDDLPTLVAGKGCGTLGTGRHIRYAHDTPLNNLWVSMLNRMDVKVATLGDSTGTLPGLV